MNKLEEIEKEFSTWAQDYGKIKYSFWEGDMSKLHLQHQKIAIKLLNPKKRDNVLDIGCGVGWGSINLAMKVSPGISYGVDVTKEMIEKSKEHAKKLNIKNVKFQKASALNLPFDNNFFDGAISTNAVHHFYKPVKMFAEIYRVLKKNSKFILVDTCASSKFIRDFEKKLKKEEKAHYKFFRLNEIKELLIKGGFRKVKGFRRDHVMYVTAIA